ncbi:lipase family protein [Streptomyces sp. NPDC020875]|uniref:lipase family protein n=1 Tax=Streptomyces sp. NPDC020875 TaxID=3154898 RepID=UPI0033C1CF9F
MNPITPEGRTRRAAAGALALTALTTGLSGLTSAGPASAASVTARVAATDAEHRRIATDAEHPQITTNPERQRIVAVPARGSGRLLRATDLPAEARPHGGPGQVIEYTSTGAKGGRVTVSGLLFAPAGPAPEDGWPVVSVAHATVGLADACARSRTTAGRFAHDPRIRAWLDAGVAVVASDYEGLGTPGPHPYLHARSAAYSLVDAVHAARQAGFGIGGTWVATGHSQGGHAALSAAVYAERYAPRLDFRGAAATAPPTEMTRLVSDRSTSPTQERALRTALYPLVIEGIRAYRAQRDFGGLLSDGGRALLPTAVEKCFPDVVRQVVGAGLTDDTVWKTRPEGSAALMRELRTRVDTPVVRLGEPVFIGQGGRDEVVQAEVTASYAARLAAAGSEVTYREYPAAGHTTVPEAADAESTAWLKERLGVR